MIKGQRLRLSSTGVLRRPRPCVSSTVFALAFTTLAFTTLAGCASVRELAALRHVDFALDDVAGARLAGIDLSRVSSFEDLTPAQTTRLLSSVLAGHLPLELDLRIAASNPGTVAAQLTRMDWTLLLAGRETVAGTLDRAYPIPAGGTAAIPIRVSVNLVEFFGRNLPELVELAAAAAGESSRPVEVGLRVLPTVATALGPVRFPAPVTVMRHMVGGHRPR